MLKNKLYHTLIIAGITGSLIISTGLVAFASSSKSTTPKTKIGCKSLGGHQGWSNGFMQKGGMQRGNPLVSVLKTQVTAGVITPAEYDAITSFLTTKESSDKVTMAAEKTKLEAMTPADRQAYMQVNKPVRENIIAELVTAKLLTQDQATKIQAAMTQRTEVQQGGPGQGMKQGNFLATLLKSQVTAGVITQAEANSATTFLKTRENERKTEMATQKSKYAAMTPAEKTAAITAKKATRDAEKAKLEAMTPADKQAYMKANRPAQENIFANLVTAGIFTQDQVDKIQASMPQRPQMGNWNGQKTVGAPTNDATGNR